MNNRAQFDIGSIIKAGIAHLIASGSEKKHDREDLFDNAIAGGERDTALSLQNGNFDEEMPRVMFTMMQGNKETDTAFTFD